MSVTSVDRPSSRRMREREKREPDFVVRAKKGRVHETGRRSATPGGESVAKGFR